MKSSRSGTTIMNYTKYSTEDLVKIVDYVEDYKKIHHDSAYKPDIIIFDTYNGSFEGRRAHGNKYVKHAYSGNLIRLIDPKELGNSPVEQLASIDMGVYVPQEMVNEILKRVETACGMWNSMTGIPETYKLRCGISAEDKKVPTDKVEIEKQRFLRKSGSVKHRISNMLSDLRQMQFEVPQMNDYGRAVIIQEDVLEDMKNTLQEMINRVYAARETIAGVETC